MKVFGITETYDPCFVPDWSNKLQDEANIIISKELTDDMIDKLVANSKRIIFHHTVTGHGGTNIEPGVKPSDHELGQFIKLIEAGFPIRNYVLRVDPIIPFRQEMIDRSTKVMEIWSNTFMDKFYQGEGVGIQNLRCRISILHLYPQVKNRFEDIGIELPWSTFSAPNEVIEFIYDLIVHKDYRFIYYSCCESAIGKIFEKRKESGVSENRIFNTPFVSFLDVLYLNLNKKDFSRPDEPQRETCGCLSKKQILGVKPGRCPHNCIYCYWKD